MTNGVSTNAEKKLLLFDGHARRFTAGLPATPIRTPDNPSLHLWTDGMIDGIRHEIDQNAKQSKKEVNRTCYRKDNK